MESFWEQFYKEHIDPQAFPSKQSWKDKLFTKLTSTILKDDRPYGYFMVMSRAEKCTPFVGRNITDDHPAHKHQVDNVNYLVSTKCEDSQTDIGQEKNGEENEHHEYMRQRYGPVNVTMTRHEVTLTKGVVPPGHVYHEAAWSKQLVPPRYTSLFPEGSCFLRDSTALELISKKCHFYPKEIDISLPEFSTFLLSAEHEKNNLDFLADFFKDVESLTIYGDLPDDAKWRVIRGPKTRYKKAPPRALQEILGSPNDSKLLGQMLVLNLLP